MPETYEERPDVHDVGGIESSELGSFVPEAHYRPIPIVWFAGAWFLQSIGMTIMYLVLRNTAAIFTILTCAIISYGVWHWANERGMKDASSGWVFTTMVALGLNFALLIVAALAN
ncbi:MAG: hypothetical protein AAGE37_03690 [Pseudomonadota bacterium]